MNILMVAPEQIPVPGNGSVEICMLAIAKELAARHTVTILSRQSKGLPPVSRTGKLTIVRVPSGSPNRYIASVLNYLKGRNYDLIQVDNRPITRPKSKPLSAHAGLPVPSFINFCEKYVRGGRQHSQTRSHRRQQRFAESEIVGAIRPVGGQNIYGAPGSRYRTF
ncbi:hypothetical protein HMSSN036_41540 [Paenibacillus macerans]|nr:hypothetical protein HMSSN036_41540 [Paenibacillus macerans]